MASTDLISSFENLSLASKGASSGAISTYEFMKVYNMLKDDILTDSVMEYMDEDRQWVEEMLDYNVRDGKISRVISVIDSYRFLVAGRDLSEDEFFQAAVLEWCIEWLLVSFRLLHDIVDDTQTRCGKSCWFKLPKVGKIAINDANLLRSHIGRLLKKHFRSKPFYINLLDLFSEADFQKTFGSMLYMITTNDGSRDFTNFKMPVYLQIVQNKTAYSFFYLPVACALLLAGRSIEVHTGIKDILLKMGTYFQIQDDYMEYFGDSKEPKELTESNEEKCSWLAVQALERANDTQVKCLQSNYGKTDPDCVSELKTMYNELHLQDVFQEYENSSYNEILTQIEKQHNAQIKMLLKSILEKTYMWHNQ